MGQQEDLVTAAYESASAGTWEALVEQWAGSPGIAMACSRYSDRSTGWTFLHWAAHAGSELGCRALIRLGADTWAATADGQRPSDLARQQGHTQLASLLQIAERGAMNLWEAPSALGTLPSSCLWAQARECRAGDPLRVAYGGGLVEIPAGARRFVDDFERTLVGWHGTYDPPCGMDGDSMVDSE